MAERRDSLQKDLTVNTAIIRNLERLQEKKYTMKSLILAQDER